MDSTTDPPRRRNRLWQAALIVTLMIAAIVAGLHAVWQLEENRRPTKAVKESGKDVFTVEVKEEPGPTIVVECDEGVFGDANMRFREALVVTGPPVNIPGGPMLIARLPSELSQEHGAIARGAIELLKRSSPERVILIAHSDCLLYDVGGAYLGHPELVRVAQYADLNKAATLIKSWLPKTKVEAYFALKEGGQVKFNPVPLQAGEEKR